MNENEKLFISGLIILLILSVLLVVYKKYKRPYPKPVSAPTLRN